MSQIVTALRCLTYRFVPTRRRQVTRPSRQCSLLVLVAIGVRPNLIAMDQAQFPSRRWVRDSVVRTSQKLVARAVHSSRLSGLQDLKARTTRRKLSMAKVSRVRRVTVEKVLPSCLLVLPEVLPILHSTTRLPSSIECWAGLRQSSSAVQTLFYGIVLPGSLSLESETKARAAGRRQNQELLWPVAAS